MWIPERGIEY